MPTCCGPKHGGVSPRPSRTMTRGARATTWSAGRCSTSSLRRPVGGSSPASARTIRTMGRRNYLIEGVSGTGKTSVCEELRRRGYAAIHGDRELAYQGDPATGEKTEGRHHEHHIWDVAKVRALA